MTILRQNIVTIVPLFLVLGLIYAFVSHTIQVKEFNWVLEQESEATGSTIHDFIHHDFELYFSVNDDQIDKTEQIVRVFDRLLTQPDVYAIVVSDLNGNRLYERNIHPAFHSGSDFLNIEMQVESDPGKRYRSELYTNSETPFLIVETSVRPDSAAEIGAEIRVFKSGSHYVDIQNEISNWLWIEIGAALITGLILSLVLTFIIKQRIVTLHKQSEAYIKGDSQVSLSESPISEFNDLGSTLTIMMNVLHKNVDWYRKSIIANEQVRSTSEIAANFKERTRNRFEETFHNKQIICDSVGNSSTGHFHAVIRHENRRVIYSGSLNIKDPVEAALISDGISRLIVRLSERLNDDDLVERINNQFFNVQVRFKQIKLEHNGTVRVSEFRNGETLLSNDIELRSEPVFIHDFNAEISEWISKYCKIAGNLAFSDLYDDIRKIAEEHVDGILVGINRTKSQ